MRADPAQRGPRGGVGPSGFELRQPGRDALHAEKLDDFDAGINRLRLEVVGPVEVRGREPVGPPSGVLMSAVAEVTLDDRPIRCDSS
jgi:hypothetical protein